MSDEKKIDTIRIKEPGTFYRTNATGTIELVCEKTGQVLATEKSLRELVAENNLQPYDPIIADLIVNKVMEGTPLTKIYQTPGLPSYAVIARWRRASEEFDTALKQAREDRAHFHRDKVIEIADNTHSKEEATINKVKMDAHKWAAERDSPEEFGARPTKDEGPASTHITIVTGVPQPDSLNTEPIEVNTIITSESKQLEEGSADGEPTTDNNDD